MNNKSRFVFNNGDMNPTPKRHKHMDVKLINSEREFFGPKELFILLQRHIWLILCFVLLSVSGTYYLLNYYVLPVYQSQGTVVIKNNENVLPGADDNRRGEGTGVGDIISRSFALDYGNSVQSAIYLFQSWELSEEVAKNLKASIESEEFDKYPTLWESYPEDSSLASDAKVASRIRRGLKVGAIEPETNLRNAQPNMLEISYQSYSPQETATIVNLAMNAFQETSLEQKQNVASKALSFLGEKKEETRIQLNNAEDQLVNFRNENRLVAIDAQANNSVNNLSQLQAEKQNLEIQLESINSSIENFETQMEAIKPGLADRYSRAIGPTIANYQERLADLRTQRFVLLSNNPQLRENPESEPELKRLNTRISELEKEIQEISKDLVSNEQGFFDTGDGNLAQELSNIQRNLIQLRLEKNQNESQVNALNKRISEAESFLDTYPDKQVQLARLESEVQRYQRLLDNIITRESEIALWQQTQNSSGTIVDQATPSFSPVKPNKVLWLGFAGTLGIVLPLAILLIRKTLSNTLYSSEQLKSYPYPLISVIYDHSLIKENGWWVTRGKTDKSTTSKDLVFYHNADSPVAESYRKIVNKVLYSDPNVPQTILVTSSAKGEGKTTLSGNLGLAFAEVDKKVLIVDCDFRRPAMHKLFSLNNKIGLKEVLFDGAKLSDAIQTTKIQDLNVLTTGSKPVSPAKLLGSEKFKELVKVIRPNYDIILFDTPPQGLVSEVTSLLNFTDLLLVVAKFGETKENLLSYTLEELDKNAETNIGLVLTFYEPKSSYDSYDTKGLHKYMYQEYYEYEKLEKKN